MLRLLKDEKDFAAFRVSKSFQNRFLKIRVRFVLNQNAPRFGFIIPKKVVPKVVDRNKIKRRIKSILESSGSKIKGVDVVFYPQKAVLKVDFKNLTLDVHDLFKKAKLWK